MVSIIFNKNILPFLAFVIFLFVYMKYPLSVQAEENIWLHYYTGSDGTKCYYSPSSITHTYVTKRPRSKYPLVKVLEKVMFVTSYQKKKEVKKLKEFDCSNRRVRILKEDTLYCDGTRTIEMKTSPWQYIKTESPHEALYNIICTSQKKK